MIFFAVLLLIPAGIQNSYAASGIDQTVGEITWFAGNFAPRGTAFCDGQLLAISQNDTLFSLLSTIYGGDGRTTFGLPEMRGRMPVDDGQGPGLTNRNIGEKSGAETATVTVNQLPSHNHNLMASSLSGESTNPTGKSLQSGFNPFLHRIYTLFNGFDVVDMQPDAIANAGGIQSHSNMSPFSTIKCLINLIGIFPGGSAPQPFLGEIRWVAYSIPTPRGWANCDGQLLPISQNQSLFSLLGTTYGGDGRTTFGLPDMRGRMPMHEGSGPGLTPHPLGQRAGTETVALTINEMPSHTNQLRGTSAIGNTILPSNQLLANGLHPLANRIYQSSNLDQNMASESVSNTGGEVGHQNMPPFLSLRCIISLDGVFPTGVASNPFIAEIRWYAGAVLVPPGYVECDGQLLPISQNQALFSLLGTTYGGDGRTTFGVPDMRGRIPIDDGRGPGLTDRRLGSIGGTETVTLTQSQMASHNHLLRAMNIEGTTISPTGNMLGVGLSSNYHNIYGTGILTDMHSSALKNSGGSQPHDNMPPYLNIKCLIAVQGIFPSRS